MSTNPTDPLKEEEETTSATSSAKKGSKKSSPAPPTTTPPSGPPTSAPGSSPAVSPSPTSGPTTSATSTAPVSKTSASISADLAKKIAEKKAYSVMARSKLSELSAGTLDPTKINLDEVYELANAAQYDAFDPQLIKLRLREVLGRSAQRMASVCLAVIFFGNNPYERVKKSVDPKRLESMISELRGINVVRTKVNSESLTLARIGQSHPVLIMHLRAELSRAGLLPSNGVASTTPAILSDLSLTPLSDKFETIKPFVVSFAKALYAHAKKSKKDNGLTEEQWLAEQEKYRVISTTSFTKDDQFGAWPATDIQKVSIGQTLALLGYDKA